MRILQLLLGLQLRKTPIDNLYRAYLGSRWVGYWVRRDGDQFVLLRGHSKAEVGRAPSKDAAVAQIAALLDAAADKVTAQLKKEGTA